MNSNRASSGRVFFGLAAVLTIASAGLAQEVNGTYVMSVAASSFTLENVSQTYATDGASQGRFATGTDSTSPTILVAGLNLPTGAYLDKVSFEVYDLDPESEVDTWVLACPSSLGSGTPCKIPSPYESGAFDGWQLLTTQGLAWTIDNMANMYLLRVRLFPGSAPGLTQFRRAIVYYHLAVSPSPAIATFTDVPTDNPYFQFVEAMVRADLTAGCGGGNFCPDAPVTRGQMAVFIAKGLGIYWPIMVPTP